MSQNETATFGGGCFWCLEAIFRQIEGVTDVVSGYAGGNCPGTPTYREVCSGKTGHAEVIRVEFDRGIIRYKDLLNIFMNNHNPTLKTNINGTYGSQYRSIILYESKAHQKIAQEIIYLQHEKGTKKILTEVIELKQFYQAEEYHQDYFTKNKEAAYCSRIITPKLEKLNKELYKK
ncbi:peptide-methionine (S)-S-oxide reductase MsrA [Cellulophaga sp. L1A9]|uniref:peptide-methionine (S)-S-oxide reductase MsrA n=1 Tax=Cellulophaga sp. L1A9 TaxID=2686362 RepID=UPI00131E375C|nr:peptide-methionine (S)-S-oxide reductase MsrA [Cellulophaga sp. L1A9]